MSDQIKPIVMPKWGLAMQEGMAARWLVEPGAEINAGDEILDIETSKIANVFESPVAGPLRRIVVGEGETVPVGALLAVVAEPSVPDAELDAFIARFQEEFAAHATEAEAAPEPETVEAGGRRIRYLALGEGEGVPIVFIHGFGGDLNNWQFNQEALAADRPTYALDLPGHGGSSKDLGTGRADIGALAATVLAFMDSKGIAKAHLVGHSLGGAIALRLALDQPDRVASVTAICSAALGPEINMAYIDGFMAAKRRKQLQPVLELLVADPAMVSHEMIEDVLKFKRLDGVEAALGRIIEGSFAGGQQAMQLAGRLGELTVPVQIIWGRQDRIIPVGHSADLPSGLQVHVFDDAGHMVHMEKAAEVNALIARMVGTCSRTRMRPAPRRACRPSGQAQPRDAQAREEAMTTRVKGIPEGYHSVTPYLAVEDGARAIAFYKEAFGATEVMRMPGPGGRVGHAEIRIGDSRIMLADEYPDMNFRSPKAYGGSPVGLHLYVEDVDAVTRQAVAAGATELRPVKDQFYGDRTGSVQDPFGHVWHIATRKVDLSPEELKRRAAEAMQQQGS